MKHAAKRILPALLALALCLGLLPGMALAEDGAAGTGVRLDFLPNGGSITSIRGISRDEIMSGNASLPDDILFIDVNSGVAGMMAGQDGTLKDFPVVSRSGYTFDGWYIISSSDANAAYNGNLTDFSDAEPVRNSTLFGADTTLAAKWSQGTLRMHTVDFDINGGMGQVPASLEVADGGTITLPDSDNITAPEGYRFAGWFDISDPKKPVKWENDTAVKDDLILYAGWLDRKSTVVLAWPQPTEPAESAEPTDSTAPAAPSFTDVAADSPFAAAIAWAVEQEITNGTGDGSTFSPGATCSRGQILTFLWRSQASPEPTIENPFTDAIPAAFQKAAVWAYEKGLVTGDTFDAAVPCTRSSSVTYMWLLADSPEANDAAFTDVSASDAYAKAISWAVEQEITNGTGDGSAFSPNATCTRGQIVTFLYRAYAVKQ